MGCNSSRQGGTTNLLHKNQLNKGKETDDSLSVRSYNSENNSKQDNVAKQNGYGHSIPVDYDSDDALFQATKIPVIACNPSSTKKYLIKLQNEPESNKSSKKRRRSKISKSKSMPILDAAEDPPPKPPKSKKKDILPDLSLFQQIDNYALKVPKSAEISVESLAEHLLKPTNSDIEKTRVFYRWITNNLTYDTDSVFKGKRKPVDPESVLRLKTSVSAGYANLFAELCRYGGIRCKCIHGYAKGYGFSYDKPFKDTDMTNHTWNVVYLDGDWRFIECTWGAGNIDSNKKFTWAYKDFYFLTDPEHLVASHFPYKNNELGDNKHWQLLDVPVDLLSFNRAIKPHPRSYAWNIDFVSHKIAFIEVKGEETVLIRGLDPYLTEVGSQLVEKDDKVIRRYSMVQKIDNENTFQITVRPPDIKTYVLKILGTIDPKDSEIHTLIEYTVKCTEVSNHLKPFPAHFGSWGPVHNYMEYGFTDELPKKMFISENGELELYLNTSKQVDAVSRLSYSESSIVDLDNCTLLETGTQQIFVKVRMPRDGYYKLRISCKTEENNYKQVINYLIDCRKPLKVCTPFPKILKAAREFNCRLLQPLSGKLSSNSVVLFRLESSVITKASVQRQIMEKNDGIWEATITTANVGEKCIISGSATEGALKNLFEFFIV